MKKWNCGQINRTSYNHQENSSSYLTWFRRTVSFDSFRYFCCLERYYTYFIIIIQKTVNTVIVKFIHKTKLQRHRAQGVLQQGKLQYKAAAGELTTSTLAKYWKLSRSPGPIYKNGILVKNIIHSYSLNRGIKVWTKTTRSMQKIPYDQCLTKVVARSLLVTKFFSYTATKLFKLTIFFACSKITVIFCSKIELRSEYKMHFSHPTHINARQVVIFLFSRTLNGKIKFKRYFPFHVQKTPFFRL